jgi:hypothetical protein
MKMLVVALAATLGACAPDLVAQHPGEGGPCDPLYRLPGVPVADCRYDWRTGDLAHVGQSVLRPDELVRIDREIGGVVDRRLPTL